MLLECRYSAFFHASLCSQADSCSKTIRALSSATERRRRNRVDCDAAGARLSAGFQLSKKAERATLQRGATVLPTAARRSRVATAPSSPAAFSSYTSSHSQTEAKRRSEKMDMRKTREGPNPDARRIAAASMTWELVSILPCHKVPASATVLARGVALGSGRGRSVLGLQVGVVARLGTLLHIVRAIVAHNVEVVVDEVALLVVAAGRDLLLAHHIVRVDLARVRKDRRHLLERSAGGFGEDEVRNDENDEVEDRESDTVGLGADRERSDLGGIKPRHAEPSPRERRVEEEEEHDRDDTGGGLAARGIRNTVGGEVLDAGNIHDGEDDHADALAGGTTEHERATAHLLDKEDGGPRGDKVLGAVGGREDTRVDVREAELLLKRLADVVRDEVDTGDLLEHLRHEAEHGTVEVALRAVGEEVRDPGRLGGDKRGRDFVQLLGDDGVIDRNVVERSHDVAGIVLAALEHEPTGRLGQEDRDKGGEDEDELERDGQTPRGRAGVEEEAAKVDPVGHGDTTGDHGTLDHDEHASLVGRRTFTLPHGDGGSVHTVTDAENDTEDEELSKAVRGSAANGADGHDDGSDPDVGPSSEQVTKVKHRDGAGKATKLVDTGHETLEHSGGRGGAVANGRRVDLGELGVPRRERVERTQHTLVVTEQQETGRGGKADGPVELDAAHAQEGRDHVGLRPSFFQAHQTHDGCGKWW
ncbi:hypothetical protein L1887_55625 [Cichorium endivia]|nr:hypothetical protein L1887_55625 [Cichorium endivia]